MLGNIPVKDFPGVDRENNKHIKLFKADSNDIKEVGRPDFGSMVLEKRTPVLGSSRIWVLPQRADDFLDRRFR